MILQDPSKFSVQIRELIAFLEAEDNGRASSYLSEGTELLRGLLQPRSRSATDDLGIDRVRETFLAYGDAAYHLADDDLPAAIDASRRALEAWEKPRGIE